MTYAKATLEQIFDNKTARVLDLLILNRPFDYTLREMSIILQMFESDVLKIILRLKSQDFIEYASSRKGRTYRIKDDEKTKSLRSFMAVIMNDKLESMSKVGKI